MDDPGGSLQNAVTAGPGTPTCAATTRKGAPCRRPIMAGAKWCWQHSHGLGLKWRSLTRNQSIVFILSVIGVVGVVLTLLAWRFPEFWKPCKNVPSQVRIRRFEFQQPERNKPALANVLYENYGPSSLEVQTRCRLTVSLSKTSGPIPSWDWPNIEESLWNDFIKERPKEIPKLVVPFDSKPWFTVIGPPLSAEIVKELTMATRRARLNIVGRFEWESDGQHHKYDFCVFTFGDGALFSCQHHNGP